MRNLLAATMAASVLAIGAGTAPAASLPLGGQVEIPGAVHKVQQLLPSPGTEGGKMRSGERGMRENGSRMGQQPRGYIDGGRERRGERGYRGEWRGRGGGDWRRYDGRRFDRRGFGYRTDCGWLRQRALETGSRYWWRQFRDCVR